MSSRRKQHINTAIARCSHRMSNLGFYPRTWDPVLRRAPSNRSHRVLRTPLVEEDDDVWRGISTHHDHRKLRSEPFHGIYAWRQPPARIHGVGQHHTTKQCMRFMHYYIRGELNSSTYTTVFPRKCSGASVVKSDGDDGVEPWHSHSTVAPP